MATNYVLRLKKNDEIISSIMDFCQEKKITSAWFTGLGAAKNATLALYDLETKKFSKKAIKGPLEIANITGNIATKDNEVLIHCHITLSDKNMSAYAGHLERADVAATVEIIFRVLDIQLTRKHDLNIGLNLLEL